MSSKASMKVGTKVKVKDKDLLGTVAYEGLTEFAAGKWIGVILKEPKGKNNGTVQGRTYFQCEDKFGTFVRQTQLVIVGDDGTEVDRPSSRASTSSTSSSSAKEISPKGEALASGAAPTKLATTPRTGIPKPSSSKLPTPGRGPTGSRSPSFTNLKSNKKETSTPQSAMKKESSFVEKDFRPTISTPAPSFSTPTSAVSAGNPELYPSFASQLVLPRHIQRELQYS